MKIFNKKIYTYIIVIAFILSLLSVTVLAVTHSDYSDVVSTYGNADYRIRASIQANSYQSQTAFMRVYATNRFDAINDTSLPYTFKLILSAMILGTELENDPFISDIISEGEFINTGSYTMPESYGVTTLIGRYTAQRYGTDIYYSIPDTRLDIDNSDH